MKGRGLGEGRCESPAWKLGPPLPHVCHQSLPTTGEQRRVCLAWTAMHMPTGAYDGQRDTMVSAQGWQLMEAPRFRMLGHF